MARASAPNWRRRFPGLAACTCSSGRCFRLLPDFWFPRIRWALCHLGGAIPYLAERLDRGFHAFRECRAHIQRPPSTYLRDFYYDTVNFHQGALQLAIEFAGADHILAGSDYPHQIGSIPAMLDAIAKLPVSEEQRASIYGLNAAKLLSLDVDRRVIQ